MNSWLRILAIGLLFGCEGGGTGQETPIPNATSGQVSSNTEHKRRDRAVPFTFSSALMGTPFTILIDDQISTEDAKSAANAAFAEIARIERLMSEWRPDSEVSAINRSAGTQSVRVSKETFAVIQQSLDISTRSEGAFDITWAGLRGLWDFKTPGPIPEPNEIKARLPNVGWHMLKVDPWRRTVRIQKQGVQIGLGGIAKGYGIDRAVEILKGRGLKRFLVNGGGDLVGFGRKRSGEPWMVGVQHPRKNGEMFTRLPVDGQAIVSSGDYERYFEREGVRYHHILDLRTGYPARQSVAVTVQAPSASLADALCTAVFVLGPIKGLKLAQEFPNVEVAVLTPDGIVTRSKGIAQHFPDRWDQR